MVIYHLGFPAQSYLAAKAYPESSVIECAPLTDTVPAILGQLDGHSDFLFHIDLSVQDEVPPCRRQLRRTAPLEAHVGSLSTRPRRGHTRRTVSTRRRALAP